MAGPLCERCEYDLAGIDVLSVCPECGHPVALSFFHREGWKNMREVGRWLDIGLAVSAISIPAAIAITAYARECGLWTSGVPGAMLLPVGLAATAYAFVRMGGAARPFVRGRLPGIVVVLAMVAPVLTIASLCALEFGGPVAGRAGAVGALVLFLVGSWARNLCAVLIAARLFSVRSHGRMRFACSVAAATASALMLSAAGIVAGLSPTGPDSDVVLLVAGGGVSWVVWTVVWHGTVSWLASGPPSAGARTQ